MVLPILDFSTIKNELFPVIANVFSKTSSMGIKIRGLEALQTLCGGSADPTASQGDGLDGMMPEPAKTKSSSAILDKYSIQEKVVPLLKAIKTKEPAVMVSLTQSRLISSLEGTKLTLSQVAALNVFKEVGKIADSDFLAMDVLPILWQFSLGPLLNLQQFQSYMTLIKSLSARIEQEQTRKLQELSSSNAAPAAGSNDFMSFGSVGGTNGTAMGNGDETDFEALVRGGPGGSSSTAEMLNDPWASASASSSTTLPSRPATNPRSHSARQASPAAAFSWSSPPPSSPAPRSAALSPPVQSASRTVTPDQSLNAFASLTPSTTTTGMNAASAPSFAQPLQPTRPGMGMSMHSMGSMNSMSVLTPSTTTTPSYAAPSQNQTTSVNWGAAAASNPWQSQTQPQTQSAFSIPPPPQQQQQSAYTGFSIAPPPPSGAMGARTASAGGMGMGVGVGVGVGASGGMGRGMGMGMGVAQQSQQQQQGQKQGIDKYESLL